jgi:glycine cleavage system H lipoate-binding protein
MCETSPRAGEWPTGRIARGATVNLADRKYSREHTWAKVEGGIASVGITDYAQGQLGDIVYLDLPKIGERVEQLIAARTS